MSQSRLTAFFSSRSDNSETGRELSFSEPGTKRRRIVESEDTPEWSSSDQQSTVTLPVSAKQRISGINTLWKSEFNWLTIVKSTNGDEEGMVYGLCHKFSRRPSKSVAGRAVWVDMPCRTTCIRRSALISHKESDSHRQAVQMEVALQASKSDGVQWFQLNVRHF